MGALVACLTMLACGTELRIDHVTSSTGGSGGASSTLPGTGGLGGGGATIGGSGGSGGSMLPPTPTFGLPEAPCPPPVWARAWEGFSIYRAAAYGPDGVLLVGTVEGTPGQTLRVLAVDATGQPLWSYEAHSDTAFILADAAADGAGNVVLAGRHAGADFGIPTTSFPNTGDWRYFTAKLDASGAPLWVLEWGVDLDAVQQTAVGLGAVPVALDSHDHIVLTGNFAGAMDLGTEILVSAGGTDIFVLELDEYGELLWAKALGGAGDPQTPFGLAVGPDDSIVVAGENVGTLDLGADTPLVAQGRDGFVAKLDAGGAVTWARTIGGPDLSSTAWIPGDVALGLGVAPTGRVALTGTLASAADLGGGPLPFVGKQSGFLAILDAGGQHLWSHAFTGPEGAVAGYDVAFDALGGVQMTGSIQSFAFPSPSFVARFDAAGNGLCSSAPPGVAGYTNAPAGWLAGYTWGVVDLGTGPLGTQGKVSGFLAKLPD